MTHKTAEQFDAEATEAVARLKEAMRAPLTNIYVDVTRLSSEMEAAGIAPHLALAILTKANTGLETAIDELTAEIEAK